MIVFSFGIVYCYVQGTLTLESVLLSFKIKPMVLLNLQNSVSKNYSFKSLVHFKVPLSESKLYCSK